MKGRGLYCGAAVMLCLLCEVVLAIAVTDLVPSSTTSLISSSTPEITEAPSVVASCPYDCTLIGAGSGNFVWFSSLITSIVATEIVVLTTKSGRITTSTSTAQATLGNINDVLSYQDFLVRWGISNQTVWEPFPGITLIWPSAMAIGAPSAFQETFFTSKDGKSYCTTVHSHLPYSLFTIPLTETNFHEAAKARSSIPASYWSAWGVQSSSKCTQDFGGIPSENIPVLSITATITSTQASLPVEVNPSTTSSSLMPTSLLEPPKTSHTPEISMPTEATKASSVTTHPPYIPSPDPSQPWTDPSTSRPRGLEDPPSTANSLSTASVGVTLVADSSAEPSGVTSTETGVSEGSSKQGISAGPTESSDDKASNTGSSNAIVTNGEDSKTGSHYLQGSTDTIPTGNSSVPLAAASAITQNPRPDETTNFPKPDVASAPVGISAHPITSFPSPATAFPPSITTAGTVVTRNSLGQYVAGTRTLTPGAPGITIDGTIVSIPLLATGPVSGVWALPVVSSGEHSDIVVDGFTFSRGSGGDLVIGAQTLTPGSPAITISGTPVYLAASGTAVIVGSAAGGLTEAAVDNVATIDGFTLSRGTSSELVIGTQTITLGSSAVLVSGSLVSLAVSGTALIAGSSTTAIPLISAFNAATIDGFTFSHGPGSDLVIGTQTIKPGSPAVIVSGTPISLSPSGSSVFIDGSAFPLSSPTDQRTILDIGGSFYTEISGSAFVIGSQTLVPGGPAITVNGTH
ncbi:MAG: hypothetical protein Q9170_005267, partial [Blastenia crenularia]